MSEVEVKISSERIDDIPLIVEWLKQIQISKYIDQKLSKPHGNHRGLSYGQLIKCITIDIHNHAIRPSAMCSRSVGKGTSASPVTSNARPNGNALSQCHARRQWS
jgi:hypothetical protein